VKKTVGSDVTQYIYLGWRCIQERNASDAIVAEYVYGNNLDEVLQMKRLDTADADGDGDTSESFMYQYHTDAQGNVVAVTLAGGNFWDGTHPDDKQNSAYQLPVGTVIEKYEYDVYGKVKILAHELPGTGYEESTVNGHPHSLIDNPIMFQGQRYDEESGLYYMKNRYYDPETGRFITRDPAASDVNLYQFVNSNPINFVDPLGLAASKGTFNAAMDTMAEQYANAKIGTIPVDWGVMLPTGQWLAEQLHGCGYKCLENSAEVAVRNALKQASNAAQNIIVSIFGGTPNQPSRIFGMWDPWTKTLNLAGGVSDTGSSVIYHESIHAYLTHLRSTDAGITDADLEAINWKQGSNTPANSREEGLAHFLTDNVQELQRGLVILRGLLTDEAKKGYDTDAEWKQQVISRFNMIKADYEERLSMNGWADDRGAFERFLQMHFNFRIDFSKIERSVKAQVDFLMKSPDQRALEAGGVSSEDYYEFRRRTGQLTPQEKMAEKAREELKHMPK
jgi:RHS repeat-associated protein